MFAVALLLGSVAVFPAARAQFALVCTDGALMADKEDCSKGDSYISHGWSNDLSLILFVLPFQVQMLM